MNHIDKAIIFSARAHDGQFRKQSNIPYITHPFAVAMLLKNEGCSEDVVIAGLLHDVIEDTIFTFDDIVNNFGLYIAEIVQGCTEHKKTAPWEERKYTAISLLRTASLEVKYVMCADKLHNIESMIHDYAILNNRLWERFNRGYEQQKWYYRTIYKSLMLDMQETHPDSIFNKLKRQIDYLFGKDTE